MTRLQGRINCKIKCHYTPSILLTIIGLMGLKLYKNIILKFATA